MQRIGRILALTLLWVVLLAPRAPAQEPSGVLIQVVALEINPADVAKWTDGVQKIVAAAKQAKLAQNYAWSFWQENIFRYRLVYPVANMAYFDDPLQWMRQFQGTPGQATLTAAFEQLNAVQARTVSDMVLQHMPAWSRETALPMANLPYAHVDEFWLKGGTEQQIDALMKDLVAFLSELGYVYPAHGYRPRLGGTGEHLIVTFFDSRENFYGKNDLERLIQTKKASARWQELLTRFTGLTTRAIHYDSDYRPNLSYSPEVQASGGGAR